MRRDSPDPASSPAAYLRARQTLVSILICVPLSILLFYLALDWFGHAYTYGEYKGTLRHSVPDLVSEYVAQENRWPKSDEDLIRKLPVEETARLRKARELYGARVAVDPSKKNCTLTFQTTGERLVLPIE